MKVRLCVCAYTRQNFTTPRTNTLQTVISVFSEIIEIGD